MILLKKLLDKLYKSKAIIFKPVPEKDIRLLRMEMAKKKLPPLPSDYLIFLSLTDGLIYNGLRFFGAMEHKREEKGYNYPDIRSVNQTFQARHRRADVLIIGEKDEDLLIYNPSSKCYQLMDKTDLLPSFNLPRFFDLIYFFSQDLLNQESDS